MLLRDSLRLQIESSSATVKNDWREGSKPIGGDKSSVCERMVRGGLEISF